MKKKNKNKLLTNIAIASALSFAVVGVGIATIYNNNYQVTKAVSYDDENYTITLNTQELNDYTYQNLCESINNSTITESNLVSAKYNNQTLNVESWDVDQVVAFSYNTDMIMLNLYIGNDNPYPEYKFIYEDENMEQQTFTYDLELKMTQASYENVKNAIELDIAANQPEPREMGNEIISTIVSGLGLTTALGGEFLTGFTALFYANNQLTDLAIFSLVMLGVAISFAVIKLVLNIIRGNTGA